MSSYLFLTNFNKKLTPYYWEAIKATEKYLKKGSLFSVSKKAFNNKGIPIDHCHSLWYKCSIYDLQIFHSYTDKYVKPKMTDIIIEDLQKLNKKQYIK